MELVKELNDLKILQKQHDLFESLPEDIYYKYFENDGQEGYCQEMDCDLDVDKHRHYETSITVFMARDGSLFGCRHVSTVYSESSMVEDCFWHLKWFEMEEVKTVTYKIKQ